jgi:hypothetical protein
MNGVGPKMTGGGKSKSGGTDPNTVGSDQQPGLQTDSREHLQRSDMTDKTDKANRPDSAAVGSWFDRQLNQLYSEVISEPLPKDMQELIDRLRAKTPSK